MIYVPEGFAHGFRTLEPDTRIAYKVSGYYDHDADSGSLWNDPELAIDWRIAPESAIVSDKDRVLSRLSDMDSPFTYAAVSTA